MALKKNDLFLNLKIKNLHVINIIKYIYNLIYIIIKNKYFI